MISNPNTLSQPTQEQIRRRRLIAGALASILFATGVVAEGNKVVQGIARFSDQTFNRLSGPSVPAAGEGKTITIGDNVRFTNSHGKVVVERIDQVSEIAQAAAEADPANLLFSNAQGMLNQEMKNNQAVHVGDTVRVPDSWKIEDIGPDG